jgi:hypothetical protein
MTMVAPAPATSPTTTGATLGSVVDALGDGLVRLVVGVEPPRASAIDVTACGSCSAAGVLLQEDGDLAPGPVAAAGAPGGGLRAARCGLGPAVRNAAHTFRYRLRRLSELAALDLDDPEQRLVAPLQLHLLAR